MAIGQSLDKKKYLDDYSKFLTSSQASATSPKINVAGAQNQLNNYLSTLQRGSVGENKYKSQYEAAYNALVNRDKFNYSQAKDPLYQQYEDMYTQNAKLAMQDTVGQVSALTGGYGNSYAETAGQAMYNQAMSGLNDKALELYNAAMDRYNMEGNQLAQNYSAAANMYGAEQADLQYAANLAEQKYQFDAARAYDQYQTELNRQMWEWQAAEQQRQQNEANAYKLAAMQQSDYQYDTSLAEQQRQYDTTYAFNKQQADIQNAQWEKEYQRALANDDRAYQQWLEEMRYQKEYDAQQQANWERNLENSNYWNQQELDYNKWATETGYAHDLEMLGLNQDFEREMQSAQNEAQQKEIAYKYAALAEQARQFDAGMQYDYWNAGQEYNYKNSALAEQKRQFDVGTQYDYDALAREYDYKDRALAEQQRQFNVGTQYDYDALAQNQYQFDANNKLDWAQFNSDSDYRNRALAETQRSNKANEGLNQQEINLKKKQQLLESGPSNSDYTYDAVVKYLDSRGADYRHVLTEEKYNRSNSLKKQYPTYQDYLKSAVNRYDKK